MFGAIVVTLIVCAIVGGYLATINWFLRQDEHYGEPVVIKKQPIGAVRQPVGHAVPARP
jgi:hypothetical protein